MASINALDITTAGIPYYDGSGTFTAITYGNTSYTPAVLFGGGGTGITYTTQVGFYTRIGNQVIVSVNIQLSSKGSSTGNVTVSLPFTTASTNVGYVFNGYLLGLNSFPGGTTQPFAPFNPSVSTFEIWGFTGGGAGAIFQFNDTHFTNTAIIRFNGSYMM